MGTKTWGKPRSFRTACLALLVGAWSFTAISQAFGNDLCQRLFEESATPTVGRMRETVSLLPKDPRVPRRAAFELWSRLSQRSPVVRDLFPEETILPVILREDSVFYSKRLVHLFTELEKRLINPDLPAMYHASVISEVWQKLLAQTTSPEIHAGLRPVSRYLMGAQKTPALLAEALGEMSLEQVQRWVYGRNPLAPSPDSLIGKYIALTGATSIVRSFPIGPGRDAPQGPKRLVVAVSSESFPVYWDLFVRENFLVHVHTRHQSTLTLSQNGMFGTYARLTSSLRFPGVHTVMPHILLSSREAQRASDFFALAAENKVARFPWELTGAAGPYAPTSGYRCCTFWFGNIPIGDTRVSEYSFAGNQEGFGAGPEPQTARLRRYDLQDALVRQVWQVPGHAQLADVLGQRDANLRGEFANPGWVVVTLTGPTSVDRVPVVFVAVPDHREVLLRDFSRFEMAR